MSRAAIAAVLACAACKTDHAPPPAPSATPAPASDLSTVSAAGPGELPGEASVGAATDGAPKASQSPTAEPAAASEKPRIVLGKTNERIGVLFRVEVHPDGRVIYKGCLDERRTKTISREAAGRLFDMVDHGGFWKWANVYHLDRVHDFNGMYVTVVEGNRTKTVEDYPSCHFAGDPSLGSEGPATPLDLCNLEKAIVEAVDVTTWSSAVRCTPF